MQSQTQFRSTIHTHVYDLDKRRVEIITISDSSAGMGKSMLILLSRLITFGDHYMIILTLTLHRCWSYVGMIGGSQDISIAPGCTDLIPIHEIFHALGRWHEQSRPDRDNFVTVNVNNVPTGNDAGHISYTPHAFYSRYIHASVVLLLLS